MPHPDIRPFRALRYTPSAGQLSDLLCPPYDVISPAQRLELLRRSPANAVRIELPVEEGRLSKQQVAAQQLEDWRADGQLAADPVAAFYRHDHAFEWSGGKHERRGFFALVRLEDPAAGIVKPHEKTLAGPRSDRVEMLRRLRTMTSPVFAIYRSNALADAAGSAPALVATSDADQHRLWPVSDPAAIARLRETVSGSLYIADGHHRYAAALAYRDERRAECSLWTGEEPENFALMELVPAGGLLVLPTHRLVAPAAVPADLEARLGRHFKLELAGPDPIGRLAEAGARGAAFILLGPAPGTARLLTPLGPGALDALLPAERSLAWRALDTAILQEAVLRGCFDLDEADITAGALRFTPEADKAAAEVVEGRAGVALLLNATPVAQVMAVADAGELMPQKSTYFYPKLPTGLVFHAHDVPAR